MKTKLLKPEEHTIVNVNEDIQYVLDIADLSGDKEYKVELVFEKSGVRAEIISLYNLESGEKLSLKTIANHKVPHTSCDTKIKGAINGKAESNYLGKIVIEKGAQQTSSYLSDALLVMGNGSHHRSDPILEIEANEVSASHSSTTGRINSDHIYYLQSRGLSKKEAEELITEGFFESLLSQIIDEDIREHVRKALNKNA